MSYWWDNGRRTPPARQTRMQAFSTRMHNDATRLMNVRLKRPGSGHLHPQSLFSRLPYDVRIIIYIYTEDDDNSPLGSRHKSLGLLLSCRKAKEELEQLVSQRVARFAVKFEKSTGVEIRIERCQRYSQSVIVEIPFFALNSAPDSLRGLIWKRNILIGLHPLFSQYLNTVRIHFISTKSSTPPHSNEQEREKLIVDMHHLLGDVGHMIDRVNRWHQFPDPNQQKRHELEKIFQERAETRYPDDPVLVKRICISWDLRDQPPTTDEAVILNGILYYSRMFRLCQKGWRGPRIFPNSRLKLRRIRKAVKEWNDPPLDHYRFSVAMCYHVCDNQHLVGETGIVSPHRWNLGLATGLMGVKHMVDRNEPAEDIVVSCKGLGGEIRGNDGSRKQRRVKYC